MLREISSMYVAKPSLSQISFHHSIVTRLPNHWEIKNSVSNKYKKLTVAKKYNRW